MAAALLWYVLCVSMVRVPFSNEDLSLTLQTYVFTAKF